MKRYTRSYVDY